MDEDNDLKKDIPQSSDVNVVDVDDSDDESDFCDSVEDDASTNVGDVPQQNIRAPIPSSQGMLVPDSFYASYQDLKRSRNRRPRHSIFDSSVEANYLESAVTASGLTSSEVRAKRIDLQTMYRSPSDITHRGTLETAKAYGSHIGSWLLVDVQNRQEFRCHLLNRDLWNNQSVRELIKHNFVLWQIDCEHPEGRRFVNYYKVIHYPFVGIVDPRTGELLKQIQNTSDLQMFCDTLVAFIVEQPPPKRFVVENGRKNGMVQKNGLIKHTKNESHLCDGFFDSERKRKHRDSSESLDDVIEIVNKKCKVNESTSVNGSTQSSHASGSSDAIAAIQEEVKPIENWKNYATDLQGRQITILFRYPSGERETFKIKSGSLLKSLVLYVYSKGFNPNYYDLVLNFPYRNLTLNPSNDCMTTLDELAFGAQEIIYVQVKDM